MTEVKKVDTITAHAATWIKLQPVQSSKLEVDQKKLALAGDSYTILQYEQDGQHWKILSPQLGEEPWYIYDAASDRSAGDHWDCSWEDDVNEKLPDELPKIAQPNASDKPAGLNLKISDDFKTQITPHISYGELTLYQEARRFTHQWQVKAAYELCLAIEEARSYFGGKPVRITSGHRPPKINRSIGGALYSEHLFRAPGYGAIDFQMPGVSVWEVQAFIDRHWPYSVGYGAPKNFVHVGLRNYARHRWDY